MFAITTDAIESVKQLSQMWGKLVADVDGTVSDEGGLDVRWADAKFAFYNALVVSTPVETEEQLRRHFSRSAESMANRERPGCLWLFDDLVAPKLRNDVVSLAGEYKLTSSFTCWGMAGDLVAHEEPSHPSIRFERVTDEQHLNAYARLNARAYGLSEEDAISTFSGSRLWREEIFAYVAYDGSNPVACAGACPVDGRLFLVLVATEAEHRRRGFGEAVTRKALYEAGQSSGIRRVCLQATADGKPVYERIGLRSNSSLQLFSPISD